MSDSRINEFKLVEQFMALKKPELPKCLVCSREHKTWAYRPLFKSIEFKCECGFCMSFDWEKFRKNALKGGNNG